MTYYACIGHKNSFPTVWIDKALCRYNGPEQVTYHYQSERGDPMNKQKLLFALAMLILGVMASLSRTCPSPQTQRSLGGASSGAPFFLRSTILKDFPFKRVEATLSSTPIRHHA